LFVVPLFVLTLLTLWVPAVSLVIGSFQHPSDGAAGGGHWTNVLGFTVATAVVRLIACIIPILFAISLAFAGSVARHVARTVFLFFALLLGPLSYALCCTLFSLQVQPGMLEKPAGAWILILSGEALITTAIVAAIALWLFPGIQSSTESEKRGANLRRMVLATVLLLGVLASGFQALVLSLVSFGGVTGSTKTLALLGYEGVIRALPQSSGVWFQFALVAVLGLVGGILLVASNVRWAFSKTSARSEPVGCVVGAISGLMLFSTVLLAAFPIFAGIFGFLGPGGRSAIEGLTPQLITALTPGIQHELLRFITWFVLVVPATYLAALGIGGLRPLGRHSEWILLPFFPFFFISIATLWSPFYYSIFKFHLLGNPVIQFYPLLTNVPFLIFLTLFFKGQTEQWMNTTPRLSYFRSVIIPSVPVTITFALASSIFVIRDVLWSIIFGSENSDLAQILLATEEELSVNRLGSLVLIFAVGSILVFFPILAVLQALVVDRLRIRAR
jgi:hypothetical protein